MDSVVHCDMHEGRKETCGKGRQGWDGDRKRMLGADRQTTDSVISPQEVLHLTVHLFSPSLLPGDFKHMELGGGGRSALCYGHNKGKMNMSSPTS